MVAEQLEDLTPLLRTASDQHGPSPNQRGQGDDRARDAAPGHPPTRLPDDGLSLITADARYIGVAAGSFR